MRDKDFLCLPNTVQATLHVYLSICRMYELYVNLHEDGDFQRQIKTDIIEFFIVSCSTFRLDSVCLCIYGRTCLLVCFPLRNGQNCLIFSFLLFLRISSSVYLDLYQNQLSYCASQGHWSHCPPKNGAAT